MTALHWSAAYVGRPWSPAFNCWALVQHLQRERWGREMPALEIAAGRFSWEQWRTLSELLRDTPWRRVEGRPAAEGDVLVVRGMSGPHVGVFVGERKCRVLHNMGHVGDDGRPVGSVRCEPLWDMLAAGYSRPEVWRHEA